eukprot:TRINITY_DN5207_c0_g1_i1.p1 TRINITY_DN5207_c0_g1~~TRINITY_DN5207_c0_g1_i1.p1  ORF type:complete len:854 (-),score=402.61 TRINITY_DN5207_c0_g1_i1:116-2677(-)
MTDKNPSLKGKRADLAVREGQDERFTKMFHDPRFKKFRKDQTKLKIDSRFESMFNDPKFHVNTSKFDSRGRLLSRGSGEDLKRFYELEKQDEESEQGESKRSAHDKKKDRMSLAARGEAPVPKKPKVKDAGKSKAKPEPAAPPKAKKKFVEFRGQRIEVDDDDDAEPSDDEDAEADDGSEADDYEDADEADGDEDAASESDEEGSDAAEDDEEGSEADDDQEGDEDDQEGDDDVPTKPMSKASLRARGEAVSDDESDESEPAEDDYDSSDIENVDPAQLQAELAAEKGGDLFEHVADGQEEEEAPLGDAARRIAVLNCDWDHFRAVDLLAICSSFVPSGGAIRSAAIYLSDFGAERIKEEELQGPVGIWKSKERADESDEDNDDDRGKGGKGGKHGKGGKAGKLGKGGKNKTSGEQASEDAGYDAEKLRQYELDKLKYYYGVLECDSVATASALYKQVDGMEVEKSSNVLDLRFIPDDVVFPREPKETCKDVPANYKFTNFYTKALQHTHVECTWDTNTDISRTQLLTSKKFSKDELANNDFKTYLASDSESDSDVDAAAENGGGEGGFTIEFDESIRPPADASEPGAFADETVSTDKKAKIRKKFQSLIESIRPEEDEGEDMEITFTPGLSEQAEGLVEKLHTDEARKDETVFEKNMRKMKEKKKERRKQRREAAAADDDKLIDDDEPAGKKAGKKGKKKALPAALTPEEEQQRKQLELLMMPEDGKAKVKKGYNLSTLELEAATSKRKKKKFADKMAKSTAQTAFELDLKDERFSDLYNRPEYAMDPTDPHYRKTLGSQAIVRERVKRRGEEREKDEAQAAKPKPSEVQALAASVKRNLQSQATKKQKIAR